MREADGLKGKKMKVYDTMDLPKGKENRGFQALPFRPDATFLPKNLLKKPQHHVLPTFEHVSKAPSFVHFIEK